MGNNWFIMDSERESKLWKNGVFIFDTSAIGALYGLIPSSQEMMMEILNKFANRTWIPAQVLYEYMKNREKMIMNPCKEHYQNPKAIINSSLIDSFDTYLKDFENEDFHPNMSTDALNKLKVFREELNKTLNEVKKIIKEEHSNQKERIAKIKEDDRILDAIDNLPHGNPFMISEIFEIIKEGELRYRNSIPPGYMDCGTKKGTQIYGDLIVWKEVLRHAKDDKKDIIFICDDVKEDWYLADEKKKSYTPRHELLKEFHDVTGQECWIYPLRTFIEKLEKYNKDKEILPLFRGLDAIKASLENREKRHLLKTLSTDSFLITCDNCGHFIEVDSDDIDWEWECMGGDERSMGIENQHIAEHYVNCPKCGHEVHITFNVWEYPVGTYNYSDIEIEGGILETDFDFQDRAKPIFEDDESVCYKCGKHGSITAEGLCNECLEEQERILSSDD